MAGIGVVDQCVSKIAAVVGVLFLLFGAGKGHRMATASNQVTLRFFASLREI